MQLPLDIAKLYNEGRPFAIYRLPGETRLRMAGTDGDELAIGLWNSPYDECIRVSSCGDGIRRGRSPHRMMNICAQQPPSWKA